MDLSIVMLVYQRVMRGILFEVFICWIQESYGNPKMVEKSQLEFNWNSGEDFS